jgi:L-amino acid N-acyltransferase YncA
LNGSTLTNMTIRLANINEAEIAQINDIYNESAKLKFLTADTQPTTLTDRIKWLLSYNQTEYPVYVAMENNKVIGWISVRPYREGRAALRYTKEVSYYIAHSHHKKGIGTILLNHVLKNASALQIKNLIAIVLEKNSGSIRLLEKFNFNQWGVLPNVADFDGEICSHLYYGLHIEENHESKKKMGKYENVTNVENVRNSLKQFSPIFLL